MLPGVSADDLARRLDLAPHPEGGWYRRTYTGSATVPTARGERPAATAILYLLGDGMASAWHRVASDELWLWHGPGSVELDVGDERRVLCAPGSGSGSGSAQVLVPGGVWQRATAHGDVLVTCVVSPGFDFADFELAE